MPNEDSFYNSHKYYRDMFEKDSASDLTEGELFDNQYRIIRKIGAGGMGTVYLVEDTVMQDNKALKKIRRELTHDLHVRQRFLQEVALSQKIMSWNVVRVHTARQCDDDVYYTMEYLEGQTLRYRLEALHESGETMSLEEIQRIMADVCKGLEDAHQVTLHRDLKPENIFIDEAGRAKLLDFGLARALKGTGLTMDAQKMGTAYYMAPEQLSKKPVKPTAALDIYSLGVIVYEMLMLDLPVGIFSPVSDHRDDVSAAMDEFIRSCLNRRPEDRPATASAFFREFDSIISSDIETLRKRQQEEEARLKREEQYKDALARASAANPNDLDAALRVWQELASNYPEKTEATEKVSEFQKRIRERDEAIRQAELEKQRERDKQIADIRQRAKKEADSGQLDDALSVLRNAQQAFPENGDIQKDLVFIEKKISDRERRDRLFHEQSAKAKQLEEAGRLDDALKVWQSLASEYRDRTEIPDTLLRLQTLIEERNEQQRQKDLRLKQEEEQRRSEAEERKKREESERKRKEEAKCRQEDEEKRLESERLERERSRRRRLVFGGIGGLILVIAVIAGALFGGGGGIVPLIEPTATPTPTPTRTPTPVPFRQQTQTFNLGGGVTLDMVYIPPGRFQMGSPDDEEGRRDNEGPVHTVELDGFWMGKFEVTQGQYRAIMGTNPSHFKGDNRPVEKVSWNDAMEFCRKLSQRTGKTFTLPTEAQWEYACRAGTTGPFSFGACLSTSDANYDGNYPLSGCSNGTYRQSTWDVGSGRANTWGLYDMHGNVYEWCLDWYGSYTSGTKRNPVGPGSGSLRVIRGGSWLNHAWYCRSAYRLRNAPSLSYDSLGFRLVSTDSS
jgi:formylglycine-generating enzyme required for sulfatase activity/serine/threonine protein kinase